MTAVSMRLHITPFNPDLLAAVVGPSLIDSVTNISYHTIPTFPENNYGFIELPAMAAEKVKKKVNGAILKGKKIKIEEAKPSKRRRIEDADEQIDPPKAPPSHENAALEKPHKRRRKEVDVIPGHELPSTRKVKRGWTDANPRKSNKKAGKAEKTKGDSTQQPSKYSDKDELLFRTKLPPNRQELQAPKKTKGKSKLGADGTLVHEFAKTTKQPSFLRQDVGLGIRGNLDYVEGKGWVDEKGEVVEPESQKAQRQREAKTAAGTTVKTSALKEKVRPSSPSASSSISDGNSESGSVDKEPNIEEEETSSSGSSSESELDGSESSEDSVASSVNPAQASNKEDDIVHPLEKLFKKPKTPASQDVAKPSLEVSTAFSFFGAGSDDDVEEEPIVPLTPFSSQDFRNRGIRSAAPTPDTAYPSRFNSYGSSGLPGDEDLEDDGEDDAEGPKGQDKKNDSQRQSDPNLLTTPSRQQSDFEKKFWESRGDNSRAWKQRRRTVLKEKRQRENKARRPKNW